MTRKMIYRNIYLEDYLYAVPVDSAKNEANIYIIIYITK